MVNVGTTSGHPTPRYVGQALGWIFSLYDNLSNVAEGRPGFHAAALQHPTGQLTTGLRYARALALHGYTVATTEVRGGDLPADLPFELAALVWRDVDDLPLLRRTGPAATQQRAAYGTDLAGRNVTGTLHDVYRWLEAEVRPPD